MDISELYQIYQKHPVITTDSRDCPEGSIFLALRVPRSTATSLPPWPWRKAVPMQ